MTHHAPLAVLADIHGNALALAAVLANARQRGVTRFANLGDTFYGPLDPAGTWHILKQETIPTVLGNQDRILLEDSPALQALPAYHAAREGIGESGLAWLASLPATLAMDQNILLCHGTPASDTAYLLEDITSGGPRMRPCAAITADIPPDAASCSLILAGHSHVPGLARCGGHTILNPGSVGLPAYDDDTPPHAMASGTPHAKYAIVAMRAGHWEVEFVCVEYDWEAAALLAEQNGRPDWAAWLGSGTA